MKKTSILLVLLSIFFIACKQDKHIADAYGNFESTNLLVMPETAGRLVSFNVEEGMTIPAGKLVGIVDTSQIHLKKLQLQASIKAIKGKLQNVEPQVNLIEKQIAILSKERSRVEALLKEEAATPKQLDDITGKLDVLKQQIITTKTQEKIANNAILSQIHPLKVQILQIEDQTRKCYIKNPFEGTVLLKLVEQSEIVAPGRPLYKIADLSKMELRAYISGTQLPHVSIGQKVILEVDKDKDTNDQLEGTISWIAAQAEFTPKTIQTKEERVNLVYAIKVRVDNSEGLLKIGMPGEVYFYPEEE